MRLVGVSTGHEGRIFLYMRSELYASSYPINRWIAVGEPAMSKNRRTGGIHWSNEKTDSHPRSAGEPDQNVGIMGYPNWRGGSVKEAELQRRGELPSRQLMFFDEIGVDTAVSRTGVEKS
jgi:hypothetical protein